MAGTGKASVHGHGSSEVRHRQRNVTAVRSHRCDCYKNAMTTHLLKLTCACLLSRSVMSSSL